MNEQNTPLPETIEVQGRTFYYDAECGVYRNSQYANTSFLDRYAWIFVALILATLAYGLS